MTTTMATTWWSVINLEITYTLYKKKFIAKILVCLKLSEIKKITKKFPIHNFFFENIVAKKFFSLRIARNKKITKDVKLIFQKRFPDQSKINMVHLYWSIFPPAKFRHNRVYSFWVIALTSRVCSGGGGSRETNTSLELFFWVDIIIYMKDNCFDLILVHWKLKQITLYFVFN